MPSANRATLFTQTEIIEAIRESPYFTALPANQLEDLAKITRIAQYEEGEIVFSKGDQATAFYVLLSGQVQIYQTSPEGKEIILHLFGPGDIFAELPVFGREKTYPASALCLKPSRMLSISGEGFRSLVAHEPEMLLNVLMRFSRRLREFGALIEDLALRNVDSRLAKYILSVSESTANRASIPIHKKTLASILGTVPETLSRGFKKFSEQGIIALLDNEIRILDRTSLQKIADIEE